MQVCAPQVVLKPPYFDSRSAMMAEVTLSICMPPYCSGTSTPLNPSSPAFLTSSRVIAKFLCSMFSMLGTISLLANSSAVCAMSRCCSLKSSGVKTSSRVRSSIRKPPPRILLAGTAVTVAIFLSLKTLSSCVALQLRNRIGVSGIIMKSAADLRPGLSGSGSLAQQHRGVHRAILQSPTATFGAGLSLSGRV